MVSWLEEGFSFMFPKPIPLRKTLKDYLDKEVDERYFLTSEKARKLVEQLVINDEDTEEEEEENVEWE